MGLRVAQRCLQLFQFHSKLVLTFAGFEFSGKFRSIRVFTVKAIPGFRESLFAVHFFFHPLKLRKC